MSAAVPQPPCDACAETRGRRWDGVRVAWVYDKTPEIYDALVAEFKRDADILEIERPTTKPPPSVRQADPDEDEEDFDDDQVTGNLTLTARPDDTTMYYASFSTGYKSGGTNTDRIGFGFNPKFGPETSETFELGISRGAIHKFD